MAAEGISIMIPIGMSRSYGILPRRRARRTSLNIFFTSRISVTPETMGKIFRTLPNALPAAWPAAGP